MVDLNLDSLILPEGVSFRLKYARTTIEYINVDPKDDWFFEIHQSKQGKMPDTGPWTIRKDLLGSMRMYAGYDAEGLTISVIETGEVLFKGPDKPKKPRKPKSK